MADATNELAGRVALVTGASRGIGAAIAERFAAAGARVACVARSLDAPLGGEPGSLRETVARIEAAGGSAIAIHGDVLEPASRAAMVEQCRARLGPVEVLVNNAAAGPYRPFEKLRPTHFALTFGANVEAALHLSQLVAPAMREQRRGWIVNISSATAELPKLPYNDFEQTGGAHLYAASKAALNRLTAGIAAELHAANVAVNTLAPVAAVITAAVRLTGADKWIKPEMIEPVEAMAEAALALASCDPAQLTGRVTYSLELLRELGREVRTLDGRALLTAANAQTR